ncbi:DUF4178 domain-containing protein [Paenibacillus sp. HB172176]|uniref:DUF4178 domain-containing protein n=1 Tax=Paenibacillus sp. HB172176 TaxID=2493690 RepID=UPI00143C2D83|nr:DUF4178 domain-containing protein [Paenibacillus sp. HB172176]
MGIFNRIRGIMKRPEPPIAERSIFTIGPGDVCEVSMITYQVIGRTQNKRRGTIMLTLQDGADMRYLFIEERESTQYSLYNDIDGRLDSITEVPTTLELDDRVYYMEEQYTDFIITEGKTPFMRGGEQSAWQYQSDDRKLMRIEWLEGRFMLYEGEEILPADVEVLRSTTTP